MHQPGHPPGQWRLGDPDSQIASPHIERQHGQQGPQGGPAHYHVVFSILEHWHGRLVVVVRRGWLPHKAVHLPLRDAV